MTAFPDDRRDLAAMFVPLARALVSHGLVVPDVLGLGLQVSPNAAVHHAQGEASTWLYTLGSTLMGRDFEAIAVPELRQQAAALADHLLT